MIMPLHNEKTPQASPDSQANCTEQPEKGKSLFAVLFGQEVYDQLIKERNRRLLDEPFGRAMMMAEFCKGIGNADENLKGSNGSGEDGSS